MLQRLFLTGFMCLACMASPQETYSADPDVDAIKASLQAQINLYQRVNNLEEKVAEYGTRLGKLEANPRTSAAAIVQQNPIRMPAEMAQGPTPYADVIHSLALLNPAKDEVLVDYGCGDARWLIAAAQLYGCNGIGVELDKNQAILARKRVEGAGLSDKIKIVEGDATTMNVGGDIGVVYQYPQTLEALKPQLTKLKRFVSYSHQVPGLAMTKDKDTYVWKQGQVAQAKPAQQYTTVTQYQTVQEYVRPWSPAGFNCGNPNCVMCNGGYRTVTKPVQVQVPVQQPAQQVAQVTQPAKTVQQTYYQQPQQTYYAVAPSNCSRCNRGNCR